MLSAQQKLLNVSISHRYGSTKIQHYSRLFHVFGVSISHRYGSTQKSLEKLTIPSESIEGFNLSWVRFNRKNASKSITSTTKSVSITHRYGSTTVFTAFSVFIIPHFPCFSTFFSKKVGQPLHSKFPQSLDSTGFFIFVKIGSEVHRLFLQIF